MGAPVDLNDAVRSIWARRRESVLGRVTVLEQAAAAVAAGRLDDALRADAAAEAHKLAGTAGSFGFPEGSRIARVLESAYQGDAPPTAAEAERLGGLTRELRACLEGEPRLDRAGS